MEDFTADRAVQSSPIYGKRIVGESTSFSCQIEIELGTWRTVAEIAIITMGQ